MSLYFKIIILLCLQVDLASMYLSMLKSNSEQLILCFVCVQSLDFQHINFHDNGWSHKILLPKLIIKVFSSQDLLI